MTIGIDIRVLANGTRTGIEEYVLNLLPRLLPLDSTIKYKLFYNAFKKIKLNYPWLNLANVELCESKIPNRLLDLFSQTFKRPTIDKFLGPPAGEAGDLDIFFSPHFLPVALSEGCKRVITFHDLSFKHHHQFFSSSRKLWHFLTFPKFQARKADKIITDSQSTKEDLIKIYGINPEKIKVIYLGISEDFIPLKKDNPELEKVKKKYSLSKNFILYFGTIEPRKNLISVIKAFELAKERFLNPDSETNWRGFEGIVIGKKKDAFSDLKLVIAGARGWLYRGIFRAVKSSRYKKDIIFTGLIEDEDKPYLYNLAKAFVYPSFFEGFGFPPLEAMACGIPTIVSNASSLSEVVGDGAIMIDPYNADELAYAIKKVLEVEDLRENLIKRGLKQAKKFDWDKTAEEVLEVFKKLK
jgi:glycosyltransferase involved in cell wall biosynthesis